MSDPLTHSPPAIRLSAFGFVKAEGPDAFAFLQSQLSSDLRALADGDAQWSALLNPQGRVIAFFGLFRTTATLFRLLLPVDAIEATLTHLKRFQLRAKLTLSSDPTPAAGGWLAAGPAPAGSLVTSTRWFGAVDTRLPDPAAAVAQRWALADIDEGLTWLSAGQREQFVAQMLSLERLGALSLKKGCYPGQEIVARSHYRGAVKRRLVHLRLTAPAQAGDRVEGGPSRSDCGVVLSFAAADTGGRALAVLATEPSESEYTIVREGLAVARAERI